MACSGIGLMLFCLRGLARREAWSDGTLKWAFWLLNIGLVGMVFISLLPYGAMQAWASVSEGLWYARSSEFIHQPIMHLFVWMRVPGDILFGAGAVALAVFAIRLWLGQRRIRTQEAIAKSELKTPSVPAE